MNYNYNKFFWIPFGSVPIFKSALEKKLRADADIWHFMYMAAMLMPMLIHNIYKMQKLRLDFPGLALCRNLRSIWKRMNKMQAFQHSSPALDKTLCPQYNKYIIKISIYQSNQTSIQYQYILSHYLPIPIWGWHHCASI